MDYEAYESFKRSLPPLPYEEYERRTKEWLEKNGG